MGPARKFLLLTGAGLALVTAGCGGDGGSKPSASSSTPKTTSSAKAPATPAAKAGPVKVTIANFDYHPRTITVAAGTRITWVNTDQTNHTVTADAGSFDVGNISEKGRKSRVFSKPGTYAYHCTYHPNMHGRVVVKKGA